MSLLLLSTLARVGVADVLPIVRHNKTGGEYIVLGSAFEESSTTPLTRYCPINNLDLHWTRPTYEFFEHSKHSGSDRFTLIGTCYIFSMKHKLFKRTNELNYRLYSQFSVAQQTAGLRPRV
jgi:hypothetical protein